MGSIDGVGSTPAPEVLERIGAAAGSGVVGSGDPSELLSRLLESEAQFRAVVANIPGAVYRCACNKDWQIRFMSDHIERILGYPASDFIDNAVRSYGSIIHPDDRPQVIDRIDEALSEGDRYSLRYRVIHADGSGRWVAEHGRAVLGQACERLWLDGVILDVTEQVIAEHDRDRAEEGLRRQAELNRHQALHDPLTGLPNRVLFHDRVQQAILACDRDGGECAVLVMDLDRFKEINDTLGHSCGDGLLVEVGRRLRSTLREIDSVARLGGDEFALVRSGADVGKVATRIRKALGRPFTFDGLPLQIEAIACLSPASRRSCSGASPPRPARRNGCSPTPCRSPQVRFLNEETNPDD